MEFFELPSFSTLFRVFLKEAEFIGRNFARIHDQRGLVEPVTLQPGGLGGDFWNSSDDFVCAIFSRFSLQYLALESDFNPQKPRHPSQIAHQ